LYGVVILQGIEQVLIAVAGIFRQMNGQKHGKQTDK